MNIDDLTETEQNEELVKRCQESPVYRAFAQTKHEQFYFCGNPELNCEYQGEYVKLRFNEVDKICDYPKCLLKYSEEE